MKLLIAMLSFLALCKGVVAQEFTTGQDFNGVTPEELSMPKYNKDTTAHAVYLNEYGLSRIDEWNDDHIKLNMVYHAKIKIFDKSGFSNAIIQIPLHNNDLLTEEITDIAATTYYMDDDDGQTRRVRLDAKRIFTIRNNKYNSTVKFIMPALRNGCIIEIKYKLITPFFENFKQWNFQAQIPKICSKYEAFIPYLWHFNGILRGSLKLSDTRSEALRDFSSFNSIKSGCSHVIYTMKDIPCFVSEDYMTASKNFMSAIYFELSEFTNPYSGKQTVISKEWKDVDYQLVTDPDFGGQLKQKEQMKNRIATIIAGKTDDLDKAKAIYSYLQKWYKWNDYTGIYSVTGIKKALNAHTGSIADINLTLATALSAADIKTETVLLSTRDNGNISTVYPVLTDFNYVIAKATIGEKSYLLDATDPLLSFGLLPLKCLNDKGRVISLDKPSYWIDLSSIQKTKSIHAFDLVMLDNGNIKGALSNIYTGYDAYEKRKAISKFNSVNEYIEDMGGKLHQLKILKSTITNLDSLDLPLNETFEIEIDANSNKNGDRSVFNPFLYYKITSNPFKQEERNYPVDWGISSDDRVNISMRLPAQYIIETPPQVVNFSMPDNSGLFATAYENNENGFTFSSVTRFNKSIYSTEEYPYLKELYNKIILSEKADMVFKKK